MADPTTDDQTPRRGQGDAPSLGAVAGRAAAPL